MAQVGEPHVEPRRAEKVRHPARIVPILRMQPEAVVRERAVHEQHGGTAVPVSTQAVQRQIHAVRRGDATRASGHS